MFLHPNTNEELALARKEKKHGVGYKGFVFFTGKEVSLKEDLRRRDFTINAMAVTNTETYAIHLEEGKIYLLKL